MTLLALAILLIGGAYIYGATPNRAHPIEVRTCYAADPPALVTREKMWLDDKLPGDVVAFNPPC